MAWNNHFTLLTYTVDRNVDSAWFCCVISGKDSNQRCQMTWCLGPRISKKLLYSCLPHGVSSQKVEFTWSCELDTQTSPPNVPWASQAWWLDFERNCPREQSELHVLLFPRLTRHPVFQSSLLVSWESPRPVRFKGREHSQTHLKTTT